MYFSKQTMDMIKDVYAFWDFVVEGSYRTNNERLIKQSAEAFERELKKNIYIFGCNDAAREFVHLFDKALIKGVFDNAESKWGTTFEGLKVLCPNEVIPKLDKKNDAIIISMRQSTDVVAEQIAGMGFDNYYSLAIYISETEPYSGWIEKSKHFLSSELEDIVMLESTNDFDGNSGALYEYLKQAGSDHKFVWVVKNKNNKSFIKDGTDEALCPKESYEDLLRYVELRAKAKWQIWDNSPILKVRPDQLNVFLQHFGMGYKKIKNYYRCPDYVDLVLTTNEFVHEMEKESLCYPENAKFIYGELPRNDVLNRKWNELSKLTDKKYRKVIFWAPTLRESSNNRKDADISYPYGISLVYSQDEIFALNKILNDLGFLLIIKPHPRQILNYTDTDFDSIMYLTGERVRNIDTYKLLTQMDAMITDYSSIVFDYMLLDRPIAWVLEDREHYKIDYLMDDPDEYMPGAKIYDMQDMYDFLIDLSLENDAFKKERRMICDRCNAPFAGKGCEKLVEVLGL